MGRDLRLYRQVIDKLERETKYLKRVEKSIATNLNHCKNDKSIEKLAKETNFLLKMSNLEESEQESDPDPFDLEI